MAFAACHRSFDREEIWRHVFQHIQRDCYLTMYLPDCMLVNRYFYGVAQSVFYRDVLIRSVFVLHRTSAANAVLAGTSAWVGTLSRRA